MCETLPESDMNFKETELTLGLPGVCRAPPPGTVLGNSTGFSEDKEGASAASVDRVVAGWPPVRACRKNVMKSCGGGGTYVKVAVDGAPYLRKVDLETHGSYEQLLRALQDLFSCLTIRYSLEGRKIIVDSVNGVEYVPTYEDRDGDWMMVGDVPWKMFVESCRRLRLMKSTEAVGADLRTGGESTSNSC